MQFLLVFALLGQADGGCLNDQASGFFGGKLDADLILKDDLKLCLGEDCDYWLTYNSTGTQLEIWTSDSDGGDSDLKLQLCGDGGTGCTFTGIFTATGGLAINANNAKLTLGSLGTGLELYFDGSDAQINGTGDLVFSLSPVVGPTQVFADSGMVGVYDQSMTSALNDGDRAGHIFQLDANSVFAPWAAADGSDGIDEIGVRYYYFNGAYTDCFVNQETLTFAGGGGDASKTTSGLIPDGATEVVIMAYTLVAGTTCSSADYGDGSTVDAYGNDIAVSAGTQLDPSDYTVNSNFNLTSAGEVTIKGVGGNCVDLSVRVMAKMCTHNPPGS
jgi:hypothetical protein